MSFSLPSLAGGEGPPAYEQCQAPSFPAVNAQAAPLHVDGQQIKDVDGRVVLLRGVNTSGDSKVPDFMPIKNASMLDPLPGWGINTLRLLFTWEAYEPTRCDYDEAYMQYYEQVVEWAEARGLYVVIDFHQDAYSRYNINGCGEGFPKWALFSEIEAAEPDNGEACDGWGLKMITDLDHHKAWEHFHKNTEGAKERYLDMVSSVAERMSKHSNVIGYELINEPWGTDTELESFFNEVGPAIRSRHPDTILFVPPHALASSGTANNMNKPAFDNMVYSPHFYDAFVIMTKAWLGTDPAGSLDGMAEKASTWGVPMMLSEYGGPAETSNIEGYMDALNAWLNKGLHHGMQWNYTPTWRDDVKDGWNTEDLSIADDNGNLRRNFRPRAYPIAIAGAPLAFSESESAINFSWQHEASKGQTEIYLPGGFLNGKQLSVTGVSCSHTANLLTCSSPVDVSASIGIE
jgi:endoglycosylceramidase